MEGPFNLGDGPTESDYPALFRNILNHESFSRQPIRHRIHIVLRYTEMVRKLLRCEPAMIIRRPRILLSKIEGIERALLQRISLQ